MTNYLLDTNIISAVLAKNRSIQRRIAQALYEQDKLFISTISYYEIWRGLLAIQASRKMIDFKAFVEQHPMVGIDSQPVLDQASQIYATLKRQGNLILDADILIAAVALTNELILVTADRHFERLENLVIENWLKD